MTLPINTIVCGDNVATLKTFPDASIDLVVTSPPYDNLRTYGGHTWDFDGVARELTRVIKPGGVIVWVVGDATVKGSETLTSMRQAIHFKDVCGLNVHDTMIWSKPNAMPQVDKTRFTQSFEYIFVFSKGKPVTAIPRMIPTVNAGKTVRRISKNDQNCNKKDRLDVTKSERIQFNVTPYMLGGASLGHPAVYPLALARDHILSWSDEGDIVLDPFAGSGTTCLAAQENGRRWIGLEIEPTYVNICKRRLGLVDETVAGSGLNGGVVTGPGPDIIPMITAESVMSRESITGLGLSVLKALNAQPIIAESPPPLVAEPPVPPAPPETLVL